MSNPFQLVWNALWDLAEDSNDLMSLIRRRNRIKYDDSLGNKTTISDGDLPELSLISAGGSINLRNSSSTTSLNRIYTWAIATGEFDINSYYNDVSWELLRAMTDWDVVLCSLEWPEDSGWHFVVQVNMSGIEEGTFMADENRGITGWAGLWQLNIDMHIRTDDMRPNGTGT